MLDLEYTETHSDKKSVSPGPWHPGRHMCKHITTKMKLVHSNLNKMTSFTLYSFKLYSKQKKKKKKGEEDVADYHFKHPEA